MNLTTSIFDKIFEPKEDRFIGIEDDLLTLSCCLYRITKDSNSPNNPNHYTSLTDVGLASKIIDKDVVLASQIKKYYNEKLIFQAVKGDIKTNFRKDLLSFINREPQYKDSKQIVKESFVGMAYRLPYFFHYDKEIERIYDDSETYKVVGSNRFQGTLKLNYIKALVKKRKYGNNIEYWFRDERNNKVMIPVDKHNPLLGLFEYLCTQDKMMVKGNFNTNVIDEYQFLSPNKWEIDISTYLREGVKTVG